VLSAAGFERAPHLLGVRVSGPTAVAVTVNVCGDEELLNVSTVGDDNPPPDGVIVMVPCTPRSAPA
jgi:hypothetical protein